MLQCLSLGRRAAGYAERIGPAPPDSHRTSLQPSRPSRPSDTDPKGRCTDPWGQYPMGVTAEKVAEKYGVSREEQDRFALRSQQLAARAIDTGAFSAEIVPI